MAPEASVTMNAAPCVLSLDEAPVLIRVGDRNGRPVGERYGVGDAAVGLGDAVLGHRGDQAEGGPGGCRGRVGCPRHSRRRTLPEGPPSPAPRPATNRFALMSPPRLRSGPVTPRHSGSGRGTSSRARPARSRSRRRGAWPAARRPGRAQKPAAHSLAPASESPPRRSKPPQVTVEWPAVSISSRMAATRAASACSVLSSSSISVVTPYW